VGTRRPLFVSEGRSEDKVGSIRRSAHLSFCLDRLRADSGNTVVFGRSLSDQDAHIVAALKAGGPRRIAVLLRPGAMPTHILAEKGRIGHLLAGHDVVFFGAATHPLGAPGLRIA
jgi:hypothetical protein